MVSLPTPDWKRVRHACCAAYPECPSESICLTSAHFDARTASSVAFRAARMPSAMRSSEVARHCAMIDEPTPEPYSAFRAVTTSAFELPASMSCIPRSYFSIDNTSIGPTTRGTVRVYPPKVGGCQMKG